jgi:hypothetical protein
MGPLVVLLELTVWLCAKRFQLLSAEIKLRVLPAVFW